MTVFNQEDKNTANINSNVPLEDKTADTRSVKDCDDANQSDDNQWKEEELDLIVFRCRD